MEFLTTLKDTPVPILLIVGGFIFLFLGIATIRKPIIIDIKPPSNRTRSFVLGVILVGIGMYLAYSPTSGPTSETIPTAITVSPTLEALTPTMLSQSTLTILSTSTPSIITGFENNCIHSSVWESYQTSTNEGGCLQLQKTGISAQEDRILISIEKNQNADWRGIYSRIFQDIDISFNIKIDKLLTLSNDPARIAFGIANSESPTTGQFLYYRETKSYSQARIEFGNSINNTIVAGTYPYGAQQELVFKIRGSTLQVFIDGLSIGEPTSILFQNPAFGIYYRPAIGSSVSSFISNFKMIQVK